MTRSAARAAAAQPERRTPAGTATGRAATPHATTPNHHHHHERSVMNIHDRTHLPPHLRTSPWRDTITVAALVVLAAVPFASVVVAVAAS